MLIEDVLTGISKIDKIDLRGSKINWQSLKKLILENKEHLKDLALPKGCSDEQLETLLLYLPSLEKLTVPSPQGTEQWLQCLPQTMEILDISDCPDLTASGLLHVGRLTKLRKLTLHGVPAGVIKDAWRDGPEDNGRWLQKLPESLRTLVIGVLQPADLAAALAGCSQLTQLYPAGPDGSEMECRDLKWQPEATIRHATDSTLALLIGLAPRLKKLTITESPLVTASGLLHVVRLTKLWSLNLRGVPAGSITDAVLDGLNSCSRLRGLQLGDRDQPQETAITAAAVCRLAVACRELEWLDLHTTADSSQAVLDGLHRADLGSDSDGDPRTIELWVPGPVFSQLRRPPSDSRITVYQW